uniref:Leucine-rich repeat-containing protein 23 n=1 Tax=Magallana gigas TaxID=29159 RepID=A0A8W8M4L4_MAGGI
MAAMDGQQAMRENEFSPVVEGNLVHTGGETHVLNFDTNVLSLDNVRVPTEMTDGAENEIVESEDEEDEDIELSPGGILDEETIGRNLSNLGRSADGSQQVFLHVQIAGFSLKDITALSNFVHLQKVELPYNELTDLSPLSSLQYMLILDVSHNKLTKLLDFMPPKNLKEANFGYNEIEEMADLSAYHYLTVLNLDHNKISKITGLEKCTRLQDLSLAHNKVERIHGLENLPLQSLNLCHNHIKKIENLETLRLLRSINLAGNNIRSLAGLEDHPLLENVDLEDNEVIDISEMKYIKESQMLRQVNLLRNPIQELPDYRLSILFRMPSLTELDRHRVEVEEKVAAVNMFNPAAKASVAGYIPPLFEQITSQYPKTAPQTVDNQVGLDVVTITEDMNRSQSAPVNNKPPQSDEDTSSDDESDSSLSMSSARKFARSPEGSVHNGKDPHLPTETMNPMELSNPRPPSVPRPTSQGQGRPGSDRHKVLPPINQKGAYMPEL